MIARKRCSASQTGDIQTAEFTFNVNSQRVGMITKVDDVQGGVACVGDTRIPVWLLEKERRTGRSDKQLLERFRALDGGGLAAAWAYVEANRGEIDENIRNDGPKAKVKG